jgi:hypothetical protein
VQLPAATRLTRTAQLEVDDNGQREQDQQQQ